MHMAQVGRGYFASVATGTTLFYVTSWICFFNRIVQIAETVRTIPRLFHSHDHTGLKLYIKYLQNAEIFRMPY